MVARRGATKLGCLFSLLIMAAVSYFAVNIGEVYYRYYRYEDAFEQELRFANQRSDDAIRRRLAALADSLGLPEEAGHVRVTRSANRISISAEYEEHVELPLFVRRLTFSPKVAGSL